MLRPLPARLRGQGGRQPSVPLRTAPRHHAEAGILPDPDPGGLSLGQGQQRPLLPASSCRILSQPHQLPRPRSDTPGGEPAPQASLASCLSTDPGTSSRTGETCSGPHPLLQPELTAHYRGRAPAPPELSGWQDQGKVPASGCGAGGGCCPARPCAEPPSTAPGSPAHRGASPGRQRCGRRAWCLLGPGPGPRAPRQQTGQVQGQHGRKCHGGGQLSPVPHSQQTWQRPGPAGHAQISSYRAGGTPVLQHTPWRTWGSPTQSPAAPTAVPGLLSGSRMRHPLAPVAATLPTLPAAGSQRGPDTAAMSCATSSGISPLASFLPEPAWPGVLPGSRGSGTAGSLCWGYSQHRSPSQPQHPHCTAGHWQNHKGPALLELC